MDKRDDMPAPPVDQRHKLTHDTLPSGTVLALCALGVAVLWAIGLALVMRFY